MAITLLAGASPFTVAAAPTQTELDLHKMRLEWDSIQDPKEVEGKYLYATFGADTQFERGEIYQNMVSLFAGKGASKYTAEIQKYADKAEEYPCAPADLAQMYLDWGDGIVAEAPRDSDGTALLDPTLRDKAAHAYLLGLRASLRKLGLSETATESKIGETENRNKEIEKRDECISLIKQLYGASPADLGHFKKAVTGVFGHDVDARRVSALLGAAGPGDAGSGDPPVAPEGDALPGSMKSHLLVSVCAIGALAVGGCWVFLRRSTR